MEEMFFDNTAVERIVNEYSDMIFRIALQYLKNKQDAEDVTQDVLFALLNCASFNDEQHLKAWLIRVAINKSKNLYNYKKRHAAKQLQDYEAPQSDKPVDDGLQKALELLSAEDREIVYLFYYEGYTAKEIGAMLGKNEKTVAKRLSRSREKLKKYLTEEQI